jgi:hypothetical protein
VARDGIVEGMAARRREEGNRKIESFNCMLSKDKVKLMGNNRSLTHVPARPFSECSGNGAWVGRSSMASATSDWNHG